MAAPAALGTSQHLLAAELLTGGGAAIVDVGRQTTRLVGQIRAAQQHVASEIAHLGAVLQQSQMQQLAMPAAQLSAGRQRLDTHLVRVGAGVNT